MVHTMNTCLNNTASIITLHKTNPKQKCSYILKFWAPFILLTDTHCFTSYCHAFSRFLSMYLWPLPASCQMHLHTVVMASLKQKLLMDCFSDYASITDSFSNTLLMPVFSLWGSIKHKMCFFLQYIEFTSHCGSTCSILVLALMFSFEIFSPLFLK